MTGQPFFVVDTVFRIFRLRRDELKVSFRLLVRLFTFVSDCSSLSLSVYIFIFSTSPLPFVFPFTPNEISNYRFLLTCVFIIVNNLLISKMINFFVIISSKYILLQDISNINSLNQYKMAKRFNICLPS